MADERGLLGLGPDHEPGRVAQETHGQVVGVAELEETGRLVRAPRVDRPGQVHGVVGHDPTGRPSSRASAVTMPGPYPGRSSRTDPVSASTSTRRCTS